MPDEIPLADLLGESPSIAPLRQRLAQFLASTAGASRPPTVLLQGETGTGKTLLARLLHRAGPRAGGPFVDVSCAAIPESLLEAELFGFERGAFTGAHRAKPGLLEAAHRGTFFLDEIGLVSAPTQAKLLKVLDDRCVRRLGSARLEPVDVWIIAATNEDLLASVHARRFREDLYHRLAMFTVVLPPLRERGHDILALAEHFLACARVAYGLPPKTLAAEARAALVRYRWPGNVRELENVIERATLFADGSVINEAVLDLPEIDEGSRDLRDVPPPARVPLDEQVSSIERKRLSEALAETNWNVSRAAERLGISRNRLRYRITRLGLRPDARPRRAPQAARSSMRSLSPLDALLDAVVDTGGARWQQRQVAWLRIQLLPAEPVDITASDASRMLALMAEKIRGFGGHVQDIGRTALVAAFGLESVEDAPQRAALAGLAVQNVRTRVRVAGSPVPSIVAAIHTRSVRVGGLADGGHVDPEEQQAAWTVLEALTKRDADNTILASESARPFLDRRFRLVVFGESEAEGIVYRIVRREDMSFGLGGRVLSPFVGRIHDFQLLDPCFDQAQSGCGQLIAVVGEPGIGKSRFVYELIRLDRLRHWRVLRTGGMSYGVTTSFLPVQDMLKRYVGIEDGDTPGQASDRVVEMVRRHGVESHLTALLALLDLPAEDPRWETLEAAQRRQAIVEAARALLTLESHIQPVLLVVEDLHWIDSATQGFLDRFVDGLATTRIVLVVTSRPEYRPGWASKSYYTHVRLDPLAPDGMRELLRFLLGSDDSLADLKRLLADRTEGNPFFLEEGVRAIVETRALIGEAGAYRLARPIQAVQVPITVQAILAARIDRLSPEQKGLLQCAAVIGNDAPLALLQRIADVPEEALRRGLGELQAAEFLYEARLLPDPAYTFKHALTQDVAYERLLPERRRALHARIVEALEQLYADRLAEHVEQLGHHAFRGEVWRKGVTYLFRAGVDAISRSANREAVTLLEQALVALEHVPEDRTALEQAIDIRRELRRALVPLGQYERILHYLREAEARAMALGDQRRLGWISVYMTNHLTRAGDRDGALASGRRALAISRALGDFGMQVAANNYLGGFVHFAAGEFRQAREVLTESVLFLRGELIHNRFDQAALPSVFSRSRLAWCLGHLGEFAEAARHADAAIGIADAADYPYSRTRACLGAGAVSLLKGDLPRAIAALERGVDLCRTWDITIAFPSVAASLGYAYAFCGRLAEGVHLLQEATGHAAAAKFVFNEVPLLAYLGEAYLFEDRPEEALALAQRELDRSRKHGYRPHEAHTCRLLGDIVASARTANLDEADEHYREAMGIAGELGMRPLVAHCHLRLGTLCRRMDKAQRAREHLTAAVTMYRAMDMSFWLEKAEAEIRALSQS